MGKPNKYDGMMHDYCVMHGWCGGVVNGEALHVSDFIPEQGIVSADQFVTWLMKAEGANPSDLAVRKDLIRIFMKHMGEYKICLLYTSPSPRDS